MQDQWPYIVDAGIPPLPMTPRLLFMLNVELSTATTSGAVYHAPGDANATKSGPLLLTVTYPYLTSNPCPDLQHYWPLRKSRITHLLRLIGSPYQQALFHTWTFPWVDFTTKRTQGPVGIILPFLPLLHSLPLRIFPSSFHAAPYSGLAFPNSVSPSPVRAKNNGTNSLLTLCFGARSSSCSFPRAGRSGCGMGARH